MTGGFEYQPGFVMTQYATGGAGTIQGLNLRDVASSVDAVVKNANANEITFYTVDATGLTTDVRRRRSGHDRAEVRHRLRRLRDAPSVSSSAPGPPERAQILARETGGQAILNTNAFDRGLDRVYRSVSTYYSIGVNLSGLPMGKYQDVRVEVRPWPDRGLPPRLPAPHRVRPRAERARATMGGDLSYGGIPCSCRPSRPRPRRRTSWCRSPCWCPRPR